MKIAESTSEMAIGHTTVGAVRVLWVPSSLRPYTSVLEAVDSSARPSTSSLPASPESVWGSILQASVKAIAPIGRLTRKIQDQCRFCRIVPPTTGPRIGASMAGIETIPITRPIRLGPATWAMISWPTGMIIPPPTPCSTRKTHQRGGGGGNGTQRPSRS